MNKTDLGRVSCKLTRPILIAFKVKSQIILHQSPTALLRGATTKSKFSKAAPPIAPLIAPESAPSSKPSRNEPPFATLSNPPDTPPIQVPKTSPQLIECCYFIINIIVCDPL